MTLQGGHAGWSKSREAEPTPRSPAGHAGAQAQSAKRSLVETTARCQPTHRRERTVGSAFRGRASAIDRLDTHDPGAGRTPTTNFGSHATSAQRGDQVPA